MDYHLENRGVGLEEKLRKCGRVLIFFRSPHIILTFKIHIQQI